MSKNKVQGLGLRAQRYDPTGRVQGSGKWLKAEGSKIDWSASQLPSFKLFDYDQ